MNIGGHVSSAGGISNTIARAEALGATCFQTFGASPRQWSVKEPSDEEVEAYKAAFKKSALTHAYFHAPYIANLGNPDKKMRTMSARLLSGHLKIAERLGIDGMVYHVGSAKEGSREKALEYVVEGMQKILKEVPGKSQLIMENAAGGGAKLGATAKEIGWLLRKVKSKRVKVCIDTAHALEAGIIERYTPAGVKKFFDEWEKEVGKDLVVMHINDSKTAFASNHDRHENLGEGHIGLAGFKNLAKEKRVNALPWILEVPGFEGTGPDEKNMKLLKACFKGSSKP